MFGECFVVVDVDFIDVKSVFVFVFEVSEDAGHLFAWDAGVGVEVYEDWFVCL